MNTSLLQPPIIKNPGTKVIYAPTISLQQMLAEAAREAGHVLQTSRPLFDVVPVSGSSELTIVGPGLGAPLAALVAETVAASGGKELQLFSIGAALGASNCPLPIGSLVFPSGALSEEGTSRVYGANEKIEIISSASQNRLEAQVGEMFEGAMLRGLIWSTDAPLLETRDKVSEFTERGAVLADMEYAALLHVCQLRNIEFAAVFLVSDIVGNQHTVGFKSKALKESLSAVAGRMVARP